MNFYMTTPRGANDADDGPDDDDEDDGQPRGVVVKTFDDAWRHLVVAVELWRLIGPARAAALEALLTRLSRGNTDRGLFLGAAELDEILVLLDGLDTALIGPVVDAHWRVPAERIDELRRAAPHLDLRPDRPLVDAIHAVGEGMANVGSVRGFLAEARARGCWVVAG